MLGAVGNPLIIWIMSSKEFRSGNSSIYIRVLAISDLIYTVARGFEEPLLVILNSHLNRDRPHEGWFYPGCIQFMFTFKFMKTFSKFVLIFLTLDRACVISMPLKSRTICTRKSVYISMFISFVIAMITAVDAFWYRYTAQFDWECPFYLNSVQYEIRYVIIVIESFGSMILLLIGTCIIIVFLLLGARNRKKLTETKADKADKNNRQIVIMVTLVAVLMSINMVFYTVVRNADRDSGWIDANRNLKIINYVYLCLIKIFLGV